MNEININTAEFLLAARKGAYVKRLHTERVVGGEQTIGHHSFGVGMLVIAITGGDLDVSLLKAALFHDLPEYKTGDTPAPVKWESELIATGIKELEDRFIHAHSLRVVLTDQEAWVLKYADTLELIFFCLEQFEMGNWSLYNVYHRAFEAFDSYPILTRQDWLDNARTLRKTALLTYQSLTTR